MICDSAPCHSSPATRLVFRPYLPVTTPEALRAARAIAMAEGCRYAYTGNLPGSEGENTYCPNCKTCVINRYGMLVGARRLETGKCHVCRTPIPGVWI